MDIGDLPGNDASWYRALLEEEAAGTSGADGSSVEISSDAATVATTVADAETPTAASPATESTAPEFLAPAPAADAEDQSPAPLDQQPRSGGVTDRDDASVTARATPPAESPIDSVPETNPPLVVAADTDGPSSISVEDEIHEPVEAVTGEAAPTDSEDSAPSTQQDTASLLSAMPRGDDEPSPMEKTSEMVGQLWTAKSPDEPLTGWEPGEIDRKMASSRPFRWTSVIGALAVVALIVVGLVLLPSITRSRAAAHREMMTAALHDLRAELPDTQTSLQVATEPDSTVSALNDLSTQLTSLTAKATALNNAGRSPLPSSPPLTSSAPIDELIPVKQRLEPLATTALTIQRRIANLVQYRTLMHDFLVLPELPDSADSALQADLRVALASAQAESASILAELPDDVSLSEHRALARDINDRFASWQVDYLEALRTQDSIVADNLIAELLLSLEALDAELVTPLAQIRRQTDADLIDLASSIDQVVALAVGEEPLP